MELEMTIDQRILAHRMVSNLTAFKGSVLSMIYNEFQKASSVASSGVSVGNVSITKDNLMSIAGPELWASIEADLNFVKSLTQQ